MKNFSEVSNLLYKEKVLDFIKNLLVKNDDDDELKKSQAAYERLTENFAELKGTEKSCKGDVGKI